MRTAVRLKLRHGKGGNVAFRCAARLVIARHRDSLFGVARMTDQSRERENGRGRPLRSQDMRFKDLAQIAIGAAAIGVPFALTEEAWTLGEQLPAINVVGIFLVSLSIISFYVYVYYHREHIATRWDMFFIRVVSIYSIAILVSAAALFLIEQLSAGDVPTSI